MSCGCTVISTPIPHAVEMLAQSTGILLNKFDDSEFKEAILWLIENKEQRLVWAKCFSQSHVTSWENIAIQYRLLFDQLTKKRI
jgi:glycosyltransferase involved in cell wall biosynthesis